MFRHFKKPDVPTSSPDLITFPFEFSSFQFTMENFVKSFTRNRVTKENLAEIMEEVNTTLKSESDSFKIWDHIAIFILLAINGGMLACILTLKVKFFVIFAIKLAGIFVGLIMNFVIWSCYLGGTSNRIRDKVQGILDTKDEYFDSKGMRWSVCAETDFPFWIELHIQSQFEMQLEKEKEQMGGKKKGPKHAGSYSESKGIMEQGSAQLRKKPQTKSKHQKLIYEGMEEEDEYNEEDLEQQQQPQHQEVEINMKKDKKIDRLYAPLEEDYEENYEDEEANI